MTTAATITANLIMDSRGFQRGVSAAGAAADRAKGKIASLSSFVQRNAAVIEKFGDAFKNAGKKMTTFITLPILGFFALLIKKALDADTALGKLANESLAKLNSSLATLGEKFLPMFIKIIDFLTSMIDKFNNASPAMQKFILFVVGVAALAGPLVSLIGTIMSIASSLSVMGGAAAGIIPAIVAMGAALWTALAPILPILLLIAAAVLLVWLAWKNWDAIEEAAFNLGVSIRTAFQGMGKAISDEAEKTKAEWATAAAFVDGKWKQFSKSAIDLTKKIAVAHDAMSAKIQLSAISMFVKLNAKFMEFQRWATSIWVSVGNTFNTVFSGIANFANAVFQSIVAGINWVIDAVNNLVDALENIVFPDEITPGSPTPFEMGLRGITKAMDGLSRQSIPQMNHAFAEPNGVATVGTSKTVNITDNRRFAAGISAGVMRMMLDNKLDALADSLEGAS